MFVVSLSGDGSKRNILILVSVNAKKNNNGGLCSQTVDEDLLLLLPSFFGKVIVSEYAQNPDCLQIARSEFSESLMTF